MTRTTTGTDHGVSQVRVLLGTERFLSQHSWSELTALMPGALRATVDVQWCPPAAFAERARDKSINVVVPLCAPCKSPVTGTVTVSSAVKKNFPKHLLYVNVHTAKNPNGEIRGQLGG